MADIRTGLAANTKLFAGNTTGLASLVGRADAFTIGTVLTGFTFGGIGEGDERTATVRTQTTVNVPAVRYGAASDVLAAKQSERNWCAVVFEDMMSHGVFECVFTGLPQSFPADGVRLHSVGFVQSGALCDGRPEDGKDRVKAVDVSADGNVSLAVDVGDRVYLLATAVVGNTDWLLIDGQSVAVGSAGIYDLGVAAAASTGVAVSNAASPDKVTGWLLTGPEIDFE